MAMLVSKAVVILRGILNNPIIPKLIKAVIRMGTAPIIPIFILLNISARRIITRIREIKILAICP